VERKALCTGPPAPQEANLDMSTPNAHTLLMNPGDVVVVHIFDAALPGQGWSDDDRRVLPCDIAQPGLRRFHGASMIVLGIRRRTPWG
jgi:hypothetical protein